MRHLQIYINYRKQLYAQCSNIEGDNFLTQDYIHIKLKQLNDMALGNAEHGVSNFQNMRQTELDDYNNNHPLFKLAENYHLIDKVTLINVLLKTEFQRIFNVSYDDLLQLTLHDFKIMVDLYNKNNAENTVYKDNTAQILHTDLTNVIILLKTLVTITAELNGIKLGTEIIDDEQATNNQ